MTLRRLDEAIANKPQPWVLKKRFDIREERSVKPTGSVYRHVDDGVAIFAVWESANIRVTMWNFRSHVRGKYRFRISAYAYQSQGKPVNFHVNAGTFKEVTEWKKVGTAAAIGALPGAQFDGNKYTWIGSANDEVSVCVAWHTSGVTKFEQLMEKEMIVGGTGGSAPIDTHSPYNADMTVTVLGKGSLVNAGCTFAGWATSSSCTIPAPIRRRRRRPPSITSATPFPIGTRPKCATR